MVTEKFERRTGMLRIFYVLCTLIGAFLITGTAKAQFVILAQDEDTVQELNTGSTLTFSSEGVGDSVTVRIIVNFQGPDNSVATIGEPELAGSRTFTIRTGALLPATLAPGRTLDFDITFNPTGLGPFSNRLTLNLTQNDLGSQPRPMNVVINLSGVVAGYSLSFQIEPDGNEVLLQDGGVLEFPETELEETSTATVIVTNRGSGPGTLRNVTFDGEDVFELVGLPLLPAEISAGQDIRFTLRFTPLERRTSFASLLFIFGLGSQGIAVMGEGVGALFLPEVTTGGVTTPIEEGGTISLPPTPLGEESAATVRITNQGNSEGEVNTLTVSGDGFNLTNTPILPATLNPGASISFSLTFEPVEAGIATGQLRINDQTFNLEAEALGAQVTYRVISESAATMVEPAETLVFPQTTIGASSGLTFEIKNTGNTGHTVTGIGLVGGSFSLSGVPRLPITLAPEQSVAFTITFEPDNTGPQSGSLTVDAATFILSGVGGELEDLPRVNIGGSAGGVQPAAQVPASVSLAQPFSVELVGRLGLTFTSEVFSDDPAVQFSTGGRSVSFTIPAGQTAAQFVTGAEEILLQTGTVAGTITLTPSFESKSGGFDVTPEPAPESRLTVARASPEIRSVQLTNLNDNGFTLQITGFSTARSVTDFDFQFTSVPDADLETPSLSVNVETPFRSWFQSGQSASFGSQFTATVNFNVTGDVTAIESVSVAAANGLGVSAPITVNVE